MIWWMEAWFTALGVDLARVLDYLEDPDSFHGEVVDDDPVMP